MSEDQEPQPTDDAPTLIDLIAAHARLRKAIDESDGRLSASSSAQLDADIEDIESASFAILRELGAEDFVRRIVQEEMRLARVNAPRNFVLRALLRIGLVSVRHDGALHWPLYIAPLHMWRWGVLRQSGLFGFFRNQRCAPWVRGRWLPWRWGFWFLGIEVGDRGSSAWGADRQRIGLFG